MKRKRIRIMLDFLAGPIWREYFDENSGKLIVDIPIIDKDELIQELDDKIQNLYSSYYHFDYKDMPCYFDEEQEKKDKEKMLDLLGQLLDRLDEINDGSFEVEDLETPRIQAL